MKELQLIAKAITHATQRHGIKIMDILAHDIKEGITNETPTEVHIYLKGSPIKAVVLLDKEGNIKDSYIREL